MPELTPRMKKIIKHARKNMLAFPYYRMSKEEQMIIIKRTEISIKNYIENNKRKKYNLG